MNSFLALPKSGYGHLLGIEVHLIDSLYDTGMLIKYPRKKSNRRWRKKYRKKFGTIKLPLIKDGVISHDRLNNIMYMNSKTYSWCQESVKRYGSI